MLKSELWFHLKAHAEVCMCACMHACVCVRESEEDICVWKHHLPHLCTQWNGCSGLCILLLITYSSCINQWVCALVELLFACVYVCALLEWIMNVYTLCDIFRATERRLHDRVEGRKSATDSLWQPGPLRERWEQSVSLGSRKEENISMWSREFMQSVFFHLVLDFRRGEKRSAVIAQTTCFTASHSSQIKLFPARQTSYQPLTGLSWQSCWWLFTQTNPLGPGASGSHLISVWLRTQVIICVG